jgi:hypothetical protein
MRHVWVLALLAACGQSSSEKSKDKEKDAARAIATSVDAPAVAADAAPTPESFIELADAIAKKSARRVTASGEAKLAEDGQPRRWATLEPEELDDGRGAYLLEAAPGRLWLVSFYADGRTMAWEGKPEDTAIEHAQGHHRGGETITFALRGGEPVVFAYEYVDDASDEDSKPVHKEFAKDGSCAAGCPPLATFEHDDSDLKVVGPAATVDTLLAK